MLFKREITHLEPVDVKRLSASNSSVKASQLASLDGSGLCGGDKAGWYDTAPPGLTPLLHYQVGAALGPPTAVLCYRCKHP